MKELAGVTVTLFLGLAMACTPWEIIGAIGLVVFLLGAVWLAMEMEKKGTGEEK